MIIFFIIMISMGCSIAAASKNNTHTTILISMDGIGWKFVDSDLTDTPNFDFVARAGVKAKNMITVNPTFTFPTHMTFLTGLYPESHGIVGNHFYDPLYKEAFFLETDCSNFDPKFFNESEPIWLTMEKRGIKTGTYFWPSSTSYDRRPSYFADHICKYNCSEYTAEGLKKLRKKKIKYQCYFDWFTDPIWNRLETVIRWIKSEDPPRLIMLYFEHADDVGHEYGPESPRYPKSVETQDRYVVGSLIDKLRKSNLLDSTNLILVSDHSMVETSSERQIDLFNAVDPDSYESYGAGFWPKPRRFEEVFHNLSRINSSHLKIYKREDIPEEYHWKHNRRIPPIFADVEDGWLLRKKSYNKTAEGTWTKGSHGWPPSEKTAAIFYAMGPAFKKGYNFTGTLRAVDIYPLLCHLLGVEPLPNNGSLHNMMHLLKANRKAENHGECIKHCLLFLLITTVVALINF